VTSKVFRILSHSHHHLSNKTVNRIVDETFVKSLFPLPKIWCWSSQKYGLCKFFL